MSDNNQQKNIPPLFNVELWKALQNHIVDLSEYYVGSREGPETKCTFCGEWETHYLGQIKHAENCKRDQFIEMCNLAIAMFGDK